MTEGDYLKANGWDNGPNGLKRADSAKVEVAPEVPEAPPVPEGLKGSDLSAEEWREYEFGPQGDQHRVTYRIANPKTLYHRPGGSTHRVVDAEGVVHCLPVPGSCGCVLRWKTRAGNGPVQF